MLTFYDINNQTELKPELEFKSRIKFDPFKVLNENLFAVALYNNNLFLFIDRLVYQFTPEFKFKLEKPPTTWETISIYSATKNYFDLLKQYLALEPCFKFKPSPEIDIKPVLKNSSCKNGFLEINSLPNPEIDIIIIKTGNEFDLIELTNTEKINRIIIYDFEKNLCRIGANQNNTLTEEITGEDPASTIHRRLFELILNYIEKNISTKITYELQFNRNAIFRERATPETLQATLSAIKSAINLIKVNQKEHREKIKTLIEIFYSENYAELEKLNLTTQIEKFYTEI